MIAEREDVALEPNTPLLSTGRTLKTQTTKKATQATHLMASVSTSKSTPTLYPSSSTGMTTSPSKSSLTQGETEILEFLDCCVPSMIHHFPAFIAYGCNSAEHLLGISTWHPQNIEQFLSKIPPNNDGECLNTMDKAHIANHFLSYFQVV